MKQLELFPEDPKKGSASIEIENALKILLDGKKISGLVIMKTKGVKPNKEGALMISPESFKELLLSGNTILENQVCDFTTGESSLEGQAMPAGSVEIQADETDQEVLIVNCPIELLASLIPDGITFRNCCFRYDVNLAKCSIGGHVEFINCHFQRSLVLTGLKTSRLLFSNVQATELHANRMRITKSLTMDEKCQFTYKTLEDSEFRSINTPTITEVWAIEQGVRIVKPEKPTFPINGNGRPDITIPGQLRHFLPVRTGTLN